MADDDQTVQSSAPALQPDQHAALVDEIGKLVNQSGGVSGLAQQFEQKGLGGLIAGWIGTGPNPPIGGEQVLQLLGRDKILEIAAKAGLSEEQVSSGISLLLPKVINELTPQGTVPDHAPDQVENALGLLKSKLFGA